MGPGRVYIDEITDWGRAGIVVLVALLPVGFLSPMLPFPTNLMIAGGCAWVGTVFLLFGVDRAVIETGGTGDRDDAPSYVGEPDGTEEERTVTVSALALAVLLVLGGGGLIALGAFVVLSP